MLDILKHIGLTSSESKVYMALLSKGKNTASGILKQADLNSGRIYDILNSLKGKGLVSALKEGKKTIFQASPPERVLDYIERKRKDVEDQKSDFEKILPQLKKTYDYNVPETNIQVFIGTEGQKTAYDIMYGQDLKDKELFILGIAEKSRYPKEIIDLLRFHVYKRRKELGLKVRKIADPKGRDEMMYTQDNSQIKYLPYTSTTAIEVLDSVTMIIMYTNPLITIVITDKNVARDYKRQLQFLWSIAKK